MSKYFATEEFFCPKCNHAHHFLSKKAKEHIKFTSQEIKKIGLLKYGVY